MAYRVIIAPIAALDLDEYAAFISQDSPTQARRWLAEARDKIQSLSDRPKLFEVIAESRVTGREWRDMSHHLHRIIFNVDDESMIVEVMRVWLMARRPLRLGDLQ